MPVSVDNFEFQRSGFWRRAFALMIDGIIVTLLVQCLAMALFPLTGGRVQFANGFNLMYCDKLDAVPAGVNVPADFGATDITDCRQGPVPGLPSSRMLRVNRFTQNGAVTTTVTIGRFLDADGRLIAPLTLDSMVLPLLLLLRFLFDRGRGTPGRRICRIRLGVAADGQIPPPAAVVTRRYAALAATLAPILLWAMLYDWLIGAKATGSGWPLLVTIVLAIPALITLLEALHAAAFGSDAWYDRLAGTRMLRVTKSGEAIAVPVLISEPAAVVAAASSEHDTPAAAEPDWSQPLVPEQAVADALGVDRAPLGVDRAPLGVAYTPLALPPPLPPPSSNNYFARHWRGELSLPKSYWINGIVFGFIVGIAVAALGFAVNSRSEAQPVLWLVTLIATWVIVALFTMWQAVGVWRSATNYKAGGKHFWGGLAKTVTVLGVLNLAYNCLFVGTAQLAGIYEIIDGDARVGAHQFKVLANGQVLEFSGGITFGVANELNGFLAAMENLRTVRLNSMGGRILEAQRMSDLIRAKGLATSVAQNCMSACTIVFLGGKERVVLPAARIGFHQPAFRGMTAASRRAAISTEIGRLQGFGLSRDFAERANTATPSGMWFPDKDELVREKVVTRVMQPQPAAAKPAPNSTPPSPSANAASPAAAPVAGTPQAMPGVAARAAAEEGRATIPADVIKRLSGEMSRLGMKKVQPVAPAPEAAPANAAPADAAPVAAQK
ncbi:RDD family protein [Bradyrhizobium lablabi]|uniref:COG3904 family protein n=1 Tax=Bradyrhizobium lablabi TaxID=722472 RepID=UPI0012AC2EB3|nr:RDD family protein [Bradyrhizobium lablabi]